MSAATLTAPEQESHSTQHRLAPGETQNKTRRRAGASKRRSSVNRRDHGSGTLYPVTNAKGEQWWFGRWHNGTSRPNRKIALVRKRGSKEGLTQTEAEKRLREMMDAEQPKPVGDGKSIAKGGERLLRALKVKGLKPTTLGTYDSLLKTHIQPPPFGDLLLHEADADDVEDLLARMQGEEKAAKTILNVYKLLSQLFEFGIKKGWCAENPCKSVEAPVVRRSKEIRFLSQVELGALLRAVDPEKGLFGSTDRALYLTAAMSGLRQGELLALRWRDVDWEASRIRVRRNYVRGHWVTPKSTAGSRAVPLIDTVAGELDRHFKRSAYQGDDDLVFGHPEKGTVLCHSALTARFKKALKAAGLRPIRFHDLRHTFGTLHAANGEVTPRMLQEWMGHSDLKTTMIYLDYAPRKNESQVASNSFSEVVLV
ncbi:MAG TPA: site-specific integrase [Solirubrobacterales bacterium]|nr:site-specific integrase [Solirubrobacterales bacterium]